MDYINLLRDRSFTLIFLLLLISPSCRPTRNEVAPNMTNRFETVFFADSSLLRGTGMFADLSQDLLTLLRLPFLFLSASLELPELRPLSSAILASDGAKSVSVGARNFELNTRDDRLLLGPLRYEAVYLIQSHDAVIDLENLMPVEPAEHAAGNPVWRTAITYGEADLVSIPIFISQATKEHVILATTLELILDQLSLLAGQGQIQIAPPFQEERVDSPSSTIWGYRNYTIHSETPRLMGFETLPLGGQADSRAIGWMLDLQSEARSLRLRYLTAPGDVTAIDLNELVGFSFQQLDEATWESDVPLEDNSYEKLFYTFSFFGFGGVI